MVYKLIEKMKFDELKDILRLRGLSKWEKSELVAKFFVAKKQQTTEEESRFFLFI